MRTKCSAANDILNKHPELKGHLNENNINVKLNNFGAVEDTSIVVNNQEFPIDEEERWLPKAKSTQVHASYSKPSIIQPLKEAIGISDDIDELDSQGDLQVEREIRELNKLISEGNVTSSKLAKIIYPTNQTTGLRTALIWDAVKEGNFDGLGKCPALGETFSRSTCSRYLQESINEGLIERKNKLYTITGAQASERTRLLSQAIELWEKSPAEKPSEIKSAFNKANMGMYNTHPSGEKPL